MAVLKPIPLLAALPFVLLVSCAAPKAVVVEEEPGPQETPAVAVPEVAGEPEPDLPPDDGLRLPTDQLLALPSDSEFRSALPPTETNGSGAVIARPPTEPPPRPKPGANGD